MISNQIVEQVTSFKLLVVTVTDSFRPYCCNNRHCK